MREVNLLTTTEYAKLRKLSVPTVRDERARGEGPPYIKLGKGRQGRCYYRLEDVLAWLERHTITPGGGERRAS